jgi:predicted Rdx family selenoprotein
MAIVLVATHPGCRIFAGTGAPAIEFPDRRVSAVAPEVGGTCLAIVDGQEIWRRYANGAWSRVATTGINLQSIASVDDTIFGGRDG